MHPGLEGITGNRDLGSSALLKQFLSLLDELDESDVYQGLTSLKASFSLMAVWGFTEAWFNREGMSQDSIKRLKKSISLSQKRVVEKAVTCLRPFERLLTISRSSLVESTLIALHQRKSYHLTCSISLPGSEGQGLCQALESKGIDVSCVPDWDLVDRLTTADAVVLGADLVTDDLVVNKWGSRDLIRHALGRGLPVFVLAEGFKHVQQLQVSGRGFYQDWSDGSTVRFVQVFEEIPRRAGISLISD